MQSSVTIRGRTHAEEEQNSKGKPTFQQLPGHESHKLNEALTSCPISIWVWGWVKLFVLKTRGNMQTKLKMDIKSWQTTISPSLDVVKNLTFSDKQWYTSWEGHSKDKCFACFKRECPDSWLKQISGKNHNLHASKTYYKFKILLAILPYLTFIIQAFIECLFYVRWWTR